MVAADVKCTFDVTTQILDVILDYSVLLIDRLQGAMNGVVCSFESGNPDGFYEHLLEPDVVAIFQLNKIERVKIQT